MKMLDNLAKNIFERRKALNISDEELSLMSGVCLDDINKLENSEDVPASSAIKICEVLNLQIDKMFEQD